MNNKPIIGVTPLYNKRLDTIWILNHYFDLINMAGGIPLMLPFQTTEDADMEKLLSLLNGVLFTGGQDVDPKYYKEEPAPELKETCSVRDEFEWRFLDKVLETDIPVLFICRGMQLLNVKKGGTLYQDLNTYYKGVTFEHSTGDAKALELVHNVKYQGGSKFDSLFDKEFKVNSLHHQGIKDLGRDLHVNLLSDDNIVEGVELTDRTFGIGLQFHPELIYDKSETVKRLIGEFISKAKEYK